MPITVFEWGPGISDLRYFNGSETVSEVQAALAKAQPGLIFAGNPHYSHYARWNHSLKEAGFKLVGGMCSINPVYGHKWTWKESGKSGGTCAESSDGYSHWIHSWYLIKPGAKKFGFDFSKRNPKATSGDVLDSFWHINYRNMPGMIGWEPRYELTYARLSKNCGVAMGLGMPKCGKELWGFYQTIAALPIAEEFPKGWRTFLRVSGHLKFGHNLAMLETARRCPHFKETK